MEFEVFLLLGEACGALHRQGPTSWLAERASEAHQDSVQDGMDESWTGVWVANRAEGATFAPLTLDVHHVFIRIQREMW